VEPIPHNLPPHNVANSAACWSTPKARLYRRELVRLGYVWKRFRSVLPAEPDGEKKTAHPTAFAAIATPRGRPI
jgi:hypothetical protein